MSARQHAGHATLAERPWPRVQQLSVDLRSDAKIDATVVVGFHPITHFFVLCCSPFCTQSVVGDVARPLVFYLHVQGGGTAVSTSRIARHLPILCFT